MFFIKIRKLNYIVQLKYIGLFLRWYLSYQTTFLSKLKTLLKLPFLIQLKEVHPETILKELCFSKRKIAWLRWKQDYSKLQIFNLSDDLICKVQLNKDEYRFQKEVNVMKAVGSLSIPIFELNKEKMYFVEPYVKDFFKQHSNFKIETLFALLTKHLYQPYKVNTIDFLSGFSNHYRGKLEIETKNTNLEFLFLTESHGDLWYKNLTYYEQRLVLCDWEYSRITVLSYDLWHYLFMCFNSLKKSIDDSFFIELKSIFNLINNKYSIQQVKVLHLIHLCEKIHFLKEVFPHAYENDIQKMDELFLDYFKKDT